MAEEQIGVEIDYRINAGRASAEVDGLASRVEGLEDALTHASHGVNALGMIFEGAFHRMGAMAVNLALHGVQQLAHTFTHLTSEYEKYQVSISGNLQAFEIIRDNNTAMAVTRDLMARIARDAAALPGETEDFVEAFKLGLPAALEAGERDLNRIAATTSRFTAAMIGENISAIQSSSDFTRILGGHAGAATPSWRALHVHVEAVSHSIASLHGQVIHGAEDWNRLTSPQRWEVMQRVIDRFNPMIARFGNTWDAQLSTWSSNWSQLRREVEKPIFDMLKNELMHANAMFDRFGPSLTATLHSAASLVASTLGNAFERVLHLVERLAENGGGLAHTFNRVFGSIVGFASHAFDRVESFIENVTHDGLSMGSVGRAIGTAALFPSLGSTMIGAAGGLATGGLALNPMGALLLPIFAALSTGAINVGHVFDRLSDTVRPLWGHFERMGQAFVPLLSLIGETLVNAFVELADVVASAIVPLTNFVSRVMETANDLAGRAHDALFGGHETAEQQQRRETDMRATLDQQNSLLTDVDRGTAANAELIAALTQQLGNTTDAHTQMNLRMRIGQLQTAMAQNASIYEDFRLMPDAATDTGLTNQDMWREVGRTMAIAHREEQAAHPDAPHNAARPGRTVVKVEIHNEINQANDPDRVLHDTVRALELALHAPVQTPHGALVPVGGLGRR